MCCLPSAELIIFIRPGHSRGTFYTYYIRIKGEGVASFWPFFELLSYEVFLVPTEEPLDK